MVWEIHSLDHPLIRWSRKAHPPVLPARPVFSAPPWLHDWFCASVPTSDTSSPNSLEPKHSSPKYTVHALAFKNNGRKWPEQHSVTSKNPGASQLVLSLSCWIIYRTCGAGAAWRHFLSEHRAPELSGPGGEASVSYLESGSLPLIFSRTDLSANATNLH